MSHFFQGLNKGLKIGSLCSLVLGVWFVLFISAAHYLVFVPAQAAAVSPVAVQELHFFSTGDTWMYIGEVKEVRWVTGGARFVLLNGALVDPGDTPWKLITVKTP